MTDIIHDSQYFPSQLQQFQYLDKYARFNYKTGKRETWPETIQRALDFLKEISHNKLTPEEYAKVYKFVLEMKVAPSMRLLAMAGDAARRDNVSIYNCSAVGIDSIETMVEELYIAMAGCGIGYSVQRQFVEKLPIVQPQVKNPITPYHEVSDSTEGWAHAFQLGLEAWFSGNDMKFGYHNIRTAGTPLKIKGGTASGPEPLKKLLNFTRKIILSGQDQKLRPLDVHDIMCKLGETIVAGGVRRSALICLFDGDDKEMRDCKNGDNIKGQEQRWMANNSAVWENVVPDDFIENQLDEMNAGMRGEPGIFSRYNANHLAPARRQALGYQEFLTNPCFAPGTIIHTRQGHFPIENLVGRVVDIWDGNNWININNFRITAKNQSMLKVVLQDGSEIKVTPYHKFILINGQKIEAKDLQEGDKLEIATTPETHGIIHTTGAYLKGFLIGNGTHHKNKPMLRLYAPKYVCEERLISSANEIPVEEKHTNVIEKVFFGEEDQQQKKDIKGLSIRKKALYPWSHDYKIKLPDEIFAWNKESKLEFIAGVLDADGCAADTTNGFMYQICSIHKTWLLDFQLLLKTIGVYSYLSLGSKAKKRNFNDGRGDYDVKECWRLTISQKNYIILSGQVNFSRLISFENKKKYIALSG
jgi:hypothetical protein